MVLIFYLIEHIFLKFKFEVVIEQYIYALSYSRAIMLFNFTSDHHILFYKMVYCSIYSTYAQISTKN